MKYQQVSVDLVNMLMTACSYLVLAGAAWVLLRLLGACFWLPRHFQRQNNMQKLLQDKVDSYEKYLAECEARDKLEGIDCNPEGIDDDKTTLDASGKGDKWRELRETLEMLKSQLDKVRNGVDITDWDYLGDENQEKADQSETGNESESRNEKDPEGKHAVNSAEAFFEEGEEQEARGTDEKKDK